MPNSNNENDNRIATNELKKLLSIKGIFVIYNYKVFMKTLPFITATVIAFIYIAISICTTINQQEVLNYLIDKLIDIFPNLLGFSLGGYAIIVGFGNTDFLKRIALSAKTAQYSVYEKLNSIFAFNLMCQVFVLVFSLAIDFSFFLTNKMGLYIPCNITQIINCIGSVILIFMATWTLLVIPYLVSNIFIFGETHHVILKYPQPPERKRNPCARR